MYTICPFLPKHSDALVSARDIRSFTNIATDRENWQKLKNLIIYAAKADKTCKFVVNANRLLLLLLLLLFMIVT